MLRGLKFAILAGAATVAGVAAVAETGAEPPNPSAMSPKEIRVHNAGLKSSDSQYIVCRRSTVTGSLAKKVRVCQTNEVWARRSDKAQQWANDAIDKGRSVPCGPSCQI